MELSTLKVVNKDRVAYITLSRPEALNAISPQVLDDLRQVIAAAGDDPEVKAVVLTSEGRAFCAGADLKYVSGFLADIRAFVDYLEAFNATMEAIEECPLPVIAAVNGFAFAGGMELLMACDMAIAAEEAQIGDQHQNFGLIGGPVMWQLPRRVGMPRSMELCLTGKWLTGKEAQEYGLVLRAVPKEKLMDEVEALLAQLRDKSRPGLIANKRALKEAAKHASFGPGTRVGASYTIHYMGSADEPREGIQAFLEKRKPVFK
ncbi:MAG: enoyl-CoA hydratase/isomerase family protein [Dehalococcoidia bacterium]